MTEGWPTVIRSMMNGCVVDRFEVNSSSVLPDNPPTCAPDAYDLQIVHLPLRSILPDGAYFGLSFHDRDAYIQLFDQSCKRLLQMLEANLKWHRLHGLLTFVCNFPVPQQNPMGRLQRRYDLRNMVFFVERLNRELANAIDQFKNVHLLDMDQIAASLGRRFVQDDVVAHISHGAALFNGPAEPDRLEPCSKVTDIFPTHIVPFMKAIWLEVLASVRTLRQMDMVKLVITDLDDTLWRGVAAELGELDSAQNEGWPLGYVEALSYLKRRGILLALVSKNDDQTVRSLWNDKYMRIDFKDFAIRKINWRPKADNVSDILSELNLNSRNTVFIDDNPVERAAVQAAFPGIRTLGGDPFTWRRILLWSAETQLATVTAESGRRTQMAQAQQVREMERQRVPRAEFLASLELRMSVTHIASSDHRLIPRALELVNKTNQFNTTGQRWTLKEWSDLIDDGAIVSTFGVADRFTEYGQTVVAIMHGSRLIQLVLSCRVLGLDIEFAALAHLLQIAGSSGATNITARFVNTDLNLACRDVFATAGFTRGTEDWHRSVTPPIPVPLHIALTVVP